jgi:hypothetical protein
MLVMNWSRFSFRKGDFAVLKERTYSAFLRRT